MKSSKISVEEVVSKIKTAMSLKIGSEFAKGDSVNPAGGSIATSANLMKDLDLELYNNNLRWNLVTELPITSHRKIIGPFLVIGRKLVVKYLRWYINPPLDQQRSFNGSITRSINLLRNITATIDGQVVQIYDQLRSLADAQKAGTEATDVRLSELGEKMGKTQAEVNSLKAKSITQITQLRADVERSSRQVNELKSELGKLTKLLNTINLERLYDVDGEGQIVSRPSCAQAQLSSENPLDKPESSEISGKSEGLDIDYFAFEQKFRGDRADIKNRQKVFLDLFRDKGEILDIGCGRGEFVELLTESGISATGIDTNDDMVSYCVEQGLHVIKKDAFEYLETMGDDSIGGIFLSQVIEHMQPSDVIRFIRLAYGKLKPGGILLIETIDPSNIVAMSTWFYMDMTHVRPLHPMTARFLLEYVGFGDIQLIHLNPDIEHEIPALQIDGASGNIAEFNKSMGFVNKVLSGPQDYAIYGIKQRGIAI